MVKSSQVSSLLYWAKQKLNAALKNYFVSEGYEPEEINVLHLYTIQLDDNEYEEYTDIYVNAEITIEEFMNMVDNLDEIVQSIDPGAYFEPVTPGIYLARIYWESIDNLNVEEHHKTISQSDLIKFGELITSVLEEDLEEEFWVDELVMNSTGTRIYVEVSSDSYKSMSYIDIEPMIIKSYQDLKDLYLNEIIDTLESNMAEV